MGVEVGGRTTALAQLPSAHYSNHSQLSLRNPEAKAGTGLCPVLALIQSYHRLPQLPSLGRIACAFIACPRLLSMKLPREGQPDNSVSSYLFFQIKLES